MDTTAQRASYVCHVFDAREIVAVGGANIGDALGPLDELALGDVYELDRDGVALPLFVHDPASAMRYLGQTAGAAVVVPGSEAGQPGDKVTFESRLTFMAPDGERAEALVIALGDAGRRVVLPLSPLEPRVEYTLIAALPNPDPVPLADVASVAFTRGTMITLSDGRQRPIEDLQPGDRVLTRDHGAQPVRHVVSRTVRAVGAFAPVFIPRGLVGNAGDLVLSQHQRLFLYQSGPDRITPTAEILVRAGDLVDGEEITIRRGGFCDYVSLVFDRHEVIYAECIPAESLLVNDETKRQLPEEAVKALEARLPDLSQSPTYGSEVPPAALPRARQLLLRGLKGA